MVHGKGYILVASVLVALLGNVVVANAALFGIAALPRLHSLALSVALSAAITALFAWSLLHQAQASARTAEELRRMVFRDRLTDVSTRDFLFDRLARRPETDGVVLMLDIDHFKRVNDSHGHLAGDAVIRTVASQLRVRCREDDIVCRFGGEEFLVFLAGADAARGARVAERLRQAVAEAQTAYGDRLLQVTVSVGATLKPESMGFETAIRVADEALYAAKRRGRNRVVLAWTEATVPHAPRPMLMRKVAGGEGETIRGDTIRPIGAGPPPRNA